MSSGLTYTYDDLIAKSEGIRSFTMTGSTQLEDVCSEAEELSQNYKSEEATKVVNAINKVREDGEDFNEAVRKFADAIHDEIAPTYLKIEQELKEATDPSSIYS